MHGEPRNAGLRGALIASTREPDPDNTGGGIATDRSNRSLLEKSLHRLEGFLRTVIFANGTLSYLPKFYTGETLIAADGGAAHCLALNLRPDVVIGDMDSLTKADSKKLQSMGCKFIHHPSQKDYTDLELALDYACDQGADDILILAALGARWDQTLANLLLPGNVKFSNTRIRLVDGNQEIEILHPGKTYELNGFPGDILSLIPIAGDAHRITTSGLEYPLTNESLLFGSTRGISNVLLDNPVTISFHQGLLMCILSHTNFEKV